MRRNIVLVGMMGAGKTAIGAELSRRLGRPFWDTDAEIERAAAMTIPEIFARDGEDFFRARESEVLSRVLAEQVPPSADLTALTAELKAINESLWKIEDDIRDLERARERRRLADSDFDTPNCPECLTRMEQTAFESGEAWSCPTCATISVR